MWSLYQNGVFDHGTDHDYANVIRNLIVNAVAGSGKSTTAVELMIRYLQKYPKRRVLFLAFNKHIVTELQSKVAKKLGADDRRVTILTCHSYGMRTLRGNRNKTTSTGYKIGGNIQVNKNKYFILGNALCSQKWNVSDEVAQTILPRIINLCDLGRLYLATNPEELITIAAHYGIDILEDEHLKAWDLINYGAKQLNIVDFTDMLYLPIRHNLRSFNYSLTIVDEAQDLSAAQRYLMLKAVKPKTGKFIAFGDDKQAINGFAGSDNDSFKKIAEIPNTDQLPLSICYRCDKSIIKLAQDWVPQIEWFDGNGHGTVVKSDTYKNIQYGDMVLCRNTFPLIYMCLKYWAEGKKAYVLGKDIGESLINLIKQNVPVNASGGRMPVPKKKDAPIKINPVVANRIDLLIANLYKSLEEYAKSRATKYGIEINAAKKTNGYQLMVEKVSSIEVIAKSCKSIKDIVIKCQMIFSEDSKEGVCLSTIHKSKGLESDRVFIIHWDLIPSKFARQSWELQQERNLQYVAITRAKRYLGFVTDFTAYDKHTNKKKDPLYAPGEEDEWDDVELIKAGLK